MMVDASKEECLDQHGKKTKGNDNVLAIYGEEFVISIEQHQVPDESKPECRHEVGEDSKSERIFITGLEQSAVQVNR